MTKLTAPLLIATIALAGCGRLGDSGWNPLSWGAAPVQTLEPEGGYAGLSDTRPLVPQITAARWEPLTEGRLLVVEGFAPVLGYSSVALATARPQPGNRLTPDADGVLRLRLVGVPPAPGSEAALPARPGVDEIRTAMAISSVQLARIVGVEITSAGNVVRLGR